MFTLNSSFWFRTLAPKITSNVQPAESMSSISEKT